VSGITQIGFFPVSTSGQPQRLLVLPAMASSQQLFTVEQVELIRRLRNTGINVSQIAAVS